MNIFLAVVIVAVAFCGLIFFLTLMITASSRAMRRNYYNPPMPDVRHPVLPSMPNLGQTQGKSQAAKQRAPVKPRDPLGKAAEELKDYFEYNRARLILRTIANAKTIQQIPPGIMNQFAAVGLKTEDVVQLLELAAACREGTAFDFSTLSGIPPHVGHAIYSALWKLYASQQ